MEIADSARKHGLSDDDILHAAAHPVALIAVSEDRVFLIGPLGPVNSSKSSLWTPTTTPP